MEGTTGRLPRFGFRPRMAQRPAHAPGAGQPFKGRLGRRGLFAAAVASAAAVLAVAFVVATRPAAPSPTRGGVSAAGGGHGHDGAARALQVVATSPTPGASGVSSAATLTVRFSAPLSARTPLPSLSPAVAGTWALGDQRRAVIFNPAAPLIPSSSESIVIPGGPRGMRGAGGEYLKATSTINFNVALGSVLRLQQLLAELNYLPVSFTPAGPPPAPAAAAQPQPGTFTWRWPNQPPQLVALWTPGTQNVITTGAVMTFEDQHQLGVDGVAGPEVWGALLQAAAADQINSQPYPYVFVSQALPETVTVYQNGAPVYATPANTGVPGAPTAEGTFTVYERFTSTTMTGTNPDGSTYSDPGIPWVSYFNGGDALHGFVRASYGFPQSDGCVEMPVANAAVVYPMTPLGTLVTVQ